MHEGGKKRTTCQERIEKCQIEISDMCVEGYLAV